MTDKDVSEPGRAKAGVGHDVLVVDDEPDALLMLRLNLEYAGFSVSEATTLAEADKILDDSTPDVVILDISLGREDGLAVIDRLREDPRFSQTKVAVISAHADPASVDRAMSLGAVEYLVKPFDAGAIGETIRRLTRGK